MGNVASTLASADLRRRGSVGQRQVRHDDDLHLRQRQPFGQRDEHLGNRRRLHLVVLDVCRPRLRMARSLRIGIFTLRPSPSGGSCRRVSVSARRLVDDCHALTSLRGRRTRQTRGLRAQEWPSLRSNRGYHAPGARCGARRRATPDLKAVNSEVEFELHAQGAHRQHGHGRHLTGTPAGRASAAAGPHRTGVSWACPPV